VCIYVYVQKGERENELVVKKYFPRDGLCI
jgi:hypothetical protein